jgi:hypothetical protein
MCMDARMPTQILMELLRETRTGQSLIILTGDGNRNNNRTSFPKVIDMAITRGWCVCFSGVIQHGFPVCINTLLMQISFHMRRLVEVRKHLYSALCH